LIFVTVGTEKYPFDRLVREIDRLKSKGEIGEVVFIQLGSCKYVPQNCEYRRFLNFEAMIDKIRKARIVVAHAGVGSVLLSLLYNKIPIIVPRLRRYGEHVDNHQLNFAKKAGEKGKAVPVYEIKHLGTIIKDYDRLTIPIKKHHIDKYNNLSNKLDEICNHIVKNAKV